MLFLAPLFTLLRSSSKDPERKTEQNRTEQNKTEHLENTHLTCRVYLSTLNTKEKLSVDLIKYAQWALPTVHVWWWWGEFGGRGGWCKIFTTECVFSFKKFSSNILKGLMMIEASLQLAEDIHQKICSSWSSSQLDHPALPSFLLLIIWIRWYLNYDISKYIQRTLESIIFHLLAPTGALVLMMVYDIYIYPPTFSDFEHLCLSILLQVSL